MIFVWILLLSTFILILSRFARTQSPFSPINMYLYGWMLVVGVMAIGMVTFNRQLTLTTFLLILAAHLFFFVGTYTAGCLPNRIVSTSEKSSANLIRDDFDRLVIAFMCFLAIVCAIMTIYDLFFGRGQLFLTSFSSGLTNIRSTHWQVFFSSASEVSPFRSLTVSASLFTATLLPLAKKNNYRYLIIVSYVSVIVVIIQSFLGAGRFLFGVLILCIFVSTAFIYGGTLVKRLVTMPRLIVGGAAAVYFLIIFPTQRNPDLVMLVERSIQWSSDAELTEWVKRIGSQPDMAWIKIFAYSTRYFSGSLDKLNYFIAETDVMSWYKLGLYNVTQASQLLGVLSDDITPWQQVRYDIAEIMKRAGWSLNPWATGIRDIGIDFGIFGMMMVMSMLGYVSQKIYILSQTKGSYIVLVATTYISISCFIFAFISPFQIRVLSNSFWLLATIAIVRHIFVTICSKQPKKDTVLH